VWANGIEFWVERVREDRSYAYAELLVRTRNPLRPEPLGPVRVNLVSTRERADVGRRLADFAGDSIDWNGLIEHAFATVLRQFREGEPRVDIGRAPRPTAPQYLISGLAPFGQTSILFRDGGSLKSTLACAAALTCITGGSIVPQWRRESHGGSVLFCDWETSQDDIAAISHGLAAGSGIHFPPERLHYLPMVRSVVDDLERIRSSVLETGAVLVILDSLGYALGDEPETNRSAIQLMTALRTLEGTTRICIGHIAKAERGKSGRGSTFGGVYLENGARNVLEVRRQEEGTADSNEGAPITQTSRVIGVYYRKTNRGPLRQPFGLEVHFGADQAPHRITNHRLPSGGELGQGLTLGQRCYLALQEHGKLPAFRVAELIEEPDARKVSVTMSRMVGKSLVRLDEDWEEDGRRAHVIYGIAARR
jgi:hypothetical protein